MTSYCNRKGVYHYKSFMMGKLLQKGKTSVENNHGKGML